MLETKTDKKEPDRLQQFLLLIKILFLLFEKSFLKDEDCEYRVSVCSGGVHRVLDALFLHVSLVVVRQVSGKLPLEDPQTLHDATKRFSLQHKTRNNTDNRTIVNFDDFSAS